MITYKCPTCHSTKKKEKRYVMVLCGGCMEEMKNWSELNSSKEQESGQEVKSHGSKL